MPDAILTTEAHSAQKPFFIGVDVGGTGIKLGVVDNEGKTIATSRIDTEPSAGYHLGLKRISAAVDQLLEKAKIQRSDVARIGLGVPGIINLAEGRLINAPNLQSWSNVLIRDDLANLTKFSVTLCNDANAAAFGEFWIGAGRVHESLVLITLGTGVGGGIVLHGRPLSGAHDFGGEFGHLILDPSPKAWMCGCGRPGHIEAYCGTAGIKRRVLEMLKEDQQSTLTTLIRTKKDFSPRDIYDAAVAGDAVAKDVILETAQYLATAITSMLHLIDPEVVLIGGAVTFGGAGDKIGELFINGIRQEVRSRILAVLADKFKIEYATLGAAAGYIGAAGVARVEHQCAAK